MIFQDTKFVVKKIMLQHLKKLYFQCYHIIFFISSGNCSTHRCKCVTNTALNKKVSCTDFCNCGPTYDNADSDPILENSNFLDDDDEKVNDDL